LGRRVEEQDALGPTGMLEVGLKMVSVEWPVTNITFKDMKVDKLMVIAPLGFCGVGLKVLVKLKSSV
jgi:hypothetical protein